MYPLRHPLCAQACADAPPESISDPPSSFLDIGCSAALAFETMHSGHCLKSRELGVKCRKHSTWIGVMLHNWIPLRNKSVKYSYFYNINQWCFAWCSFWLLILMKIYIISKHHIHNAFKNMKLPHLQRPIGMIGILTGSPSDKFRTVKLSSGVALTSSGQINY